MSAGEKRIVAVFVVLAWFLGLGAGFRAAQWKADREARQKPESEITMEPSPERDPESSKFISVDVVCTGDEALVTNRLTPTRVKVDHEGSDVRWTTLEAGASLSVSMRDGSSVRSVSVECAPQAPKP